MLASKLHQEEEKEERGGVGVVGWGGEGGPLAVKEMLVPANQKSRGLPNSGKYISFVLLLCM